MLIDHIGIAVKSIEAGIEHWIGVFGYKQMTEVILNTRQKVKVVFLTKENSLTVKFIEPSGETSPLNRFVKRGGGLHHLCFKCDNMDNEVARLQTHGVRVLAKSQPGEAFESENIAFVYTKQGVNVEIIDTMKRAGKLPGF